MSLSGQQRKELQEALIDAFPDEASLEQMLSLELDKRLKEIAIGGNLKDIVFKLIQTAEAEGWVKDLVRGACRANPGNPKLRAIAKKLLPPSLPPGEGTRETTPQLKDKYYSWLRHKYNSFQTEELSEIELSQIGELPLSNVFLPLYCAVIYRENARNAIIPAVEDNSTNSQEERTIWKFLNLKSIVLLGAAGSGKTTLLKHVITVYASKKQKDWDEKAPERIPVLLLIREVYQKIVDTDNPLLPDLISEYIDLRNQPTQLSKWFNEELDQGNCLVMLDGLDEVASEQARKKVTDWVKKQKLKYYKNIFILTSRPLASKDEYLDAKVFLEVQPFNKTQIPKFISRWYRETINRKSHGIDKSSETKNIEATTKAELLLKQIEKSSSLKAMAVNPLLLTMICTLHDRNSYVPNTPIELYKKICELLLKKRKLNGVSDQHKQSVLQVLALELMQKRVTKFSLDEGESWVFFMVIKEQLACLSNDATEAGKNVLRHMCEIGLLKEESKNERTYYQFAHFSFQEYLAACQIKKTSQKSFENLIKKNLRWWEKTILWYASMGEKEGTQQLINYVESLKTESWASIRKQIYELNNTGIVLELKVENNNNVKIYNLKKRYKKRYIIDKLRHIAIIFLDNYLINGNLCMIIFVNVLNDILCECWLVEREVERVNYFERILQRIKTKNSFEGML